MPFEPQDFRKAIAVSGVFSPGHESSVYGYLIKQRNAQSMDEGREINTGHIRKILSKSKGMEFDYTESSPGHVTFYINGAPFSLRVSDEAFAVLQKAHPKDSVITPGPVTTPMQMQRSMRIDAPGMTMALPEALQNKSHTLQELVAIGQRVTGALGSGDRNIIDAIEGFAHGSNESAKNGVIDEADIRIAMQKLANPGNSPEARDDVTLLDVQLQAAMPNLGTRDKHPQR
jgi:hypothetical protein